MSTVVDEGVEFETVWSGSDGWLDDKRGDFPPKMLSRVEYAEVKPEKPRRILRSDAYEVVRDLFTDARMWQTGRLREESGLTPCEFELAINRLRRDGTIVSLERGVVALRVKVAA